MKQHITIDQLNELSFETRKKLEKFATEHGYTNREEVLHDDGDDVLDYISLPLLSIGQMIEYLEENTEKILYIDSYFPHQMGYSHNYGTIYKDMPGPAYAIAWTNNLCDDLWEACKEALNEPTN